MDGFGSTSSQRDDDPSSLAPWETIVTNAVGRVIEFWGFKHNHGRTWALLYLRDEPMSAADLQEELDLSKGAVSMITKDLRQWSIVQRTRVSQSRATHYLAEHDFLEMVRRVIRDRELNLVAEVREHLDEALEVAEDEEAPEHVVERIRKMYRLADLIQNSLELFLSSARLDVNDAEDLL